MSKEADEIMTNTLVDEGIDLQAEIEKARASRTTASKVVQLALDNNIELFRSGEGRFASFTVDGHMETARIEKYGAFADYLQMLYYRQYQSGIPSEAKTTAIETLRAQARFDGDSHPVAIRICWHESSCYFALSDNERQVVEISGNGWKVIPASDSPIRFCLSPTALPLPMPDYQGKIQALRPLLNCDDDGFRLIVGFLVSCFLKTGTLPILAIAGEHGTGKSCLSARLRKIIDPVSVIKRSTPRDEEALKSMVACNYMILIDNCSGISGWLSDALCGIASGSGFASRQKYSDATEHVVEARSPIILNGIDDIAGKADLADRTLLVRLQPFATHASKSERLLDQEFEQKLPMILGGLLNLVSNAIRNLNDVPDIDGVRLIDAAQFITASELDEEKGSFLQIYIENRAEQSNLSVEGEPVYEAMVSLLREEGAIEKIRVSDLLEKLKQHERKRTDNNKLPEGWPKRPNMLSAELRRMAPGLRNKGIDYQDDKKTRTGKLISLLILSHFQENEPSQSSQEGPNAIIEPVVLPQSRDDSPSADHHASSSTVAKSEECSFQNERCDDPATVDETSKQDDIEPGNLVIDACDDCDDDLHYALACAKSKPNTSDDEIEEIL